MSPEFASFRTADAPPYGGVHAPSERSEQGLLTEALDTAYHAVAGRAKPGESTSTVATVASSFLKAVPLFMGPGRGMLLSAVIHGIDEVHRGDSTSAQLGDFALGSAKGVGSKLLMDKFGGAEMSLATKGLAIGGGSSFIESSLTRNNWINQRTGELDFTGGLEKTAVQTAFGAGVGMAAFPLGNALAGKVTPAAQALLSTKIDSAMVSAVTAGGAFGFTSGVVGETASQITAGKFDPFAIAKHGVLEGLSTAAAGGVGHRYSAQYALTHDALRSESKITADGASNGGDTKTPPETPRTEVGEQPKPTELAAKQRALQLMETLGLKEANGDYTESLLPLMPKNKRSVPLTEAQSAEFRNALDALDKGLGSTDSSYLRTLHKLVSDYSASDRSQQIDAVYAKLFESRAKRFEGTDKFVTDLMHVDLLTKHADYLAKHFAWEQAAKQLQTATEIQGSTLGQDHPQVAGTLNKLADSLAKTEKFADAEATFNRSMRILDHANQETRDGFKVDQQTLDSSRLDSISGLARIYSRTGRHAEAPALLEQVLKVQPSEATQPKINSVLQRLADSYLYQGRVSEAKALYESARKSETGNLNDGKIHRTIGDTITAHNNPYLETITELGDVGRNPFPRPILTDKYSWAIPNAEALAAIAEQGKIVEVGAGNGYWASLLRANGVDVVAYDSNPVETGTNDFHTSTKTSWTDVAKGDSKSAAQHPDRALMLSWPPQESSMAYDTLKAYKGNTLIYIGEGRGGCTANQQFFDRLARDWEPIEEVDIPQWKDMHDTLQIYKRRT